MQAIKGVLIKNNCTKEYNIDIIILSSKYSSGYRNMSLMFLVDLCGDIKHLNFTA